MSVIALLALALQAPCPSGFITTDGPLPKDALGVLWSGERAPAMKVERLDSRGPLDLGHTKADLGMGFWVFGPESPSVDGRYRFTTPDRKSVTVAITDLAIAPLLEQVTLVTRQVADGVEVELVLPAAARPYEHALLFTALIDDAPRACAFGRTVLVPRRCPGATVKVDMSAFLPGTRVRSPQRTVVVDACATDK